MSAPIAREFEIFAFVFNGFRGESMEANGLEGTRRIDRVYFSKVMGTKGTGPGVVLFFSRRGIVVVVATVRGGAVING